MARMLIPLPVQRKQMAVYRFSPSIPIHPLAGTSEQTIPGQSPSITKDAQARPGWQKLGIIPVSCYEVRPKHH